MFQNEDIRYRFCAMCISDIALLMTDECAFNDQVILKIMSENVSNGAAKNLRIPESSLLAVLKGNSFEFTEGLYGVFTSITRARD